MYDLSAFQLRHGMFGDYRKDESVYVLHICPMCKEEWWNLEMPPYAHFCERCSLLEMEEIRLVQVGADLRILEN